MDIMEIHSKILFFYENEINKIKECENKTQELKNMFLQNNNKLIEYQINCNESYLTHSKYYSIDYYLHKVSFILQEYSDILNTPLSIDFMTNKVTENPRKQELTSQYLKIIKEFPNIKNYMGGICDIQKVGNINTESDVSEKTVCPVCSNDRNFEIVENYKICIECGVQQMTSKTMNSYNDGDRINIYTKYSYDRKNHFRDCINQYQGIQHTKIEDDVYLALENEFKKHHLLVGDENTPKLERFKNITKKHVLLFLKELKLNKHYENFVLIHSKMTGKSADNISHLTPKLLEDFEKLTELYDKMNKEDKLPKCDSLSFDISRKNFINTQYVLYALLCRHKHKIDKSSINMLKTKDRLFWHDKVIKVLFEQLGWNFTEMFL